MSSYIITISCIIHKRVRGEPLPYHRWSLGRYGMAVNIGALAFLLPVFVFAFFPLATPVTIQTMNWSIVMYGGIILVATAYYFLGGRNKYVPPVALVKRET